MSRCSIVFHDGKDSVTVEGSTVSEALAMKVEYLLNQGAEAVEEPTVAAEKPSGFLSKVKGGTDA